MKIEIETADNGYILYSTGTSSTSDNTKRVFLTLAELLKYIGFILK